MDRVRAKTDSGMTLPEVLVSVTVTGMLVAAMATATTVILRQSDNSRGRINNSRAEQSIGTWMPTDLASAETVSTAADASPCGTVCPSNVNVSGSNALMLTWTGSVEGTTEAVETTTTVSYRYIQAIDLEWQLIRVECYSVAGGAPTCSQNVVLHDLVGPPAGIEYYPGVTAPTWAVLVTLATDPSEPGDESTAPGEDPTYYVKNGRRVTVTVNGGGDLAGAGGGADTITLTAGGVNRETELGTTNITGAPTFAATRSRCGGNFGLIVDTSGSIGSTNMAYVRNGINAFIDAFAGTPIKLQIVRFSTTASTLGATSWTKYYDLLVESDVNALKSLVNGLSSTGGTNYEDGMFRMFRNSDGTVQSVLPSTVIFFTDGIPTYSRMNATSASSPAVAHPDDAGLANGTGSSYSQLTWNRANRVLREFEVDLERLIGVYVGSDVNGQSLWVQQGAGYHLENFIRGFHHDYQRGSHLENWERGYYVTYQRGSHLGNWERGYNLTYQRANNGLTYERKVGSSWNSTSRGNYESNNTVPGESDGWRARVSGTIGDWKSTSEDNYNKSNLNPPNTDADGFRAIKNYSSPYTFWEPTTESTYNSNNTTSDSSDGWRVSASYSAPYSTWTTVTQAEYNAGNTTADESDGWRAPKTYASPYTFWEAAPEAAYTSNNTTSDESDGWRATTVYAAPFTTWTTITQSAYDAGNTTADESDSYRTVNIYTSPYSLWESTTEAAYNAGNTATGNSDGWDATKVYTEPFTFHESSTSYYRPNRDILKQLVAPGGAVAAVESNGAYTNAEQATYYELPNFSQFSGAMTSLALAECGGTVTLQTKVGSTSAADPFTYQNSIDLTTATTSALYRSGTFDYELSNGTAVTATISPMETSTLDDYAPVSWSCKSAGADYPFTATAINGGPWQSITLSVAPNTAISCTYTVTLR